MNRWLFKLSECKFSLQGNLKVLQCLHQFFKDLLQRVQKLDDKELSWWNMDSTAKSLARFLCQMDQIVQDAEDLLDKAKQKLLQAQSREEFVRHPFKASSGCARATRFPDFTIANLASCEGRCKRSSRIT